MHPAYSVIFFTVASGAGYGLLGWLIVLQQWGSAPLDAAAAVWVAVVALALVTAGLLSSTLHLGHPERAWRAISQWRTSWLSREGLLAILTYLPALLLLGLWWQSVTGAAVAAAAMVTLLLAVATVFSTAMIYAALTTIPRWANSWVPWVYLGLAAASGGLLLVGARALMGGADAALRFGALAVLVLAWLLKWGYWRHIDAAGRTSHVGSATGLSTTANVRSLELPHTSANFVMQEMGYRIARKHAARLRRLALLAGLAVPSVCLLSAGPAPLWLEMALILAAVAAGMSGLLIERWLFFAEAEHLVTLYYGAGRV
jgi:DMSO reductase anchor subunit